MAVLTNEKVNKKSFDVYGDKLVTVSINGINAQNEAEAKIEYTNIIDEITTHYPEFTVQLPSGKVVKIRINGNELEKMSVFDNEVE